jgi:hypothetical protein
MTVTRRACADSGNLIGELSLPVVTVIDTPGFGRNDMEERAAINHLVTALYKIFLFTVYTRV